MRPMISEAEHSVRFEAIGGWAVTTKVVETVASNGDPVITKSYQIDRFGTHDRDVPTPEAVQARLGPDYVTLREVKP